MSLSAKNPQHKPDHLALGICQRSPLAYQRPCNESIPSSPGHELEWIECIKSRKQPSCHPGYHVLVDVPITLSVLAMKLGRSIKFDPDKEQIIGDEEAARLAIPEYRPPWKFPAKYL